MFAVDVGECQLDEKLAADPRVAVMDGVNARGLQKNSFSEALDGIVTDISFISLTYVLPVFSEILGEGGCVYALVKPQFECGPAALDKHGIVKDAKRRRAAIGKIYDCALSCGLAPLQICTAPEHERKNKEFVMFLQKGATACEKEKILSIEK